MNKLLIELSALLEKHDAYLWACINGYDNVSIGIECDGVSKEMNKDGSDVEVNAATVRRAIV